MKMKGRNIGKKSNKEKKKTNIEKKRKKRESGESKLFSDII
jgi:hypothetical protein